MCVIVFPASASVSCYSTNEVTQLHKGWAELTFKRVTQCSWSHQLYSGSCWGLWAVEGVEGVCWWRFDCLCSFRARLSPHWNRLASLRELLQDDDDINKKQLPTLVCKQTKRPLLRYKYIHLIDSFFFLDTYMQIFSSLEGALKVPL